MCTISFLSSVYMILPTIEFVLKDNVGESAAVLLPALVCDSLFFLVLPYVLFFFGVGMYWTCRARSRPTTALAAGPVLHSGGRV